MKVVHIITSLEQGGAQSILFNLIKELNTVDHIVVSLSPPSFFSNLFNELGLEVYHCNIKGLLSLPNGLRKLYHVIRESSPDIVQTWMYHSDFFGGLIAKLLRVKSIVWGIHHTNHKLNIANLSSIIFKYMCALTSYFIPDHIICCAYSTMISHKKSLYCSQKLICIPNGYNHSTFYPDNDLRSVFRKSLGLSENCFVLGYPARFHEQKDHQTLLSVPKY